MKIIKYSFSALALFTAFSCTASAQPPEFYDKAGGWDISVSHDAEGRFEVCFATLEYDNGEAVIFFTNGEVWTLGLLLSRWQLDANEAYDVAIQFGSDARLPAKALAGEDNQSVLLDRDFTADIEAAKKAENMYLHTAAGSLRYAIPDAGSAIVMVETCARKNAPSPAE